MRSRVVLCSVVGCQPFACESVSLELRLPATRAVVSLSPTACRLLPFFFSFVSFDVGGFGGLSHWGPWHEESP